MEDFSNDLFKELFRVIQARKGADPKSSYVASLFQKGLNKILQKVGEEATEVIIAAKDEKKEDLVYELADLYFHTLVLMAEKEIDPKEIMEELGKRFGVSGIEEKANRKKDNQ
ncbi:MAG: phosphoribosyl-ATP pyrophosphohydrolase [bacterium]